MRDLVLVFPGQGSQYVGMGLDLYSNFSVAKRVFEEIDDILKRNLSSVILNGPGDELLKTENAQIALFAVSVSVFRVLISEFGHDLLDRILCMAGHSVGEYTAVHVAGFMELKDAVQILDVRSAGMAECSAMHPGAMFAFVGSNYDSVNTVVKDVSSDSGLCCIANDNGGGQFVISIENSLIDKLLESCNLYKLRPPIKLKTSGAFHSRLMVNAQLKVEKCMQDINFRVPKFSVILNASAELSSNPDIAKKMLIQQITSQVRWQESIELASSLGGVNFIEVGAGVVLANLVKRITKTAGVVTSICNANSIGTILPLLNIDKQILVGT